jgi:hypothetical protein
MICMTESWMALASSRTGREKLALVSCTGGVDDEFLFVPALVEEAEAPVFESGGAALGAVNLWKEMSCRQNLEKQRLRIIELKLHFYQTYYLPLWGKSRSEVKGKAVASAAYIHLSQRTREAGPSSTFRCEHIFPRRRCGPSALLHLDSDD